MRPVVLIEIDISRFCLYLLNSDVTVTLTHNLEGKNITHVVSTPSQQQKYSLLFQFKIGILPQKEIIKFKQRMAYHLSLSICSC